VADIDLLGVDLRQIYDGDYFSGGEYGDYLTDKEAHVHHFKSRVKAIKRLKPSGDLIEIGCAYGFFLKAAQGDYRVRGYDIAKDPVAYACDVLGVPAQCEDFCVAAVEPRSADIIVMWDTIEHLPRPDLLVRKAAEVLRPGGFLALTTGDIGSFVARVRRGKWRLIQPPAHLHYFNRETISRLLEAEGFSAVSIRSDAVRRSLRQVCYGLFQHGRKRPSRLYRAVSRSVAGNVSFPLNMFDIMLVTAMKPG
jgi:SAM-dependent methyltransferase